MGKIYGENLWGKFMGKICGEILRGNFAGKIYGENALFDKSRKYSNVDPLVLTRYSFFDKPLNKLWSRKTDEK